MESLPGSFNIIKKPAPGLGEGTTICSEAIEIDHAKGIYLWDSNGKRYTDMFSQTWSLPLGHNNRKILESVKRQISKITHLRTAYSTQDKTELAHKIIELAPKDLVKVNFALHGSLAVECAMKLAINYYDNRDKILYLEDGFHGRTFATMGISWKLPDSKFKNYFTNGIEVKKNLIDIEEKMKFHSPAAIILELVQGNSGCKILDKELVQGIRKLCNQYDVAMIIDEIQTGFGCMGVNFLCSEYGVAPDILVFGKAIGGGFPLAGTIYREKYSLQSGDHSFTFAHNPVSLTAALAYLNELKPVLENAKKLSPQILKYLKNIQEKYPCLKNARCLGLKGAIDVFDDNGIPDCKNADLIVLKLLKKGVIISNSRYRQLGNTLMFQPPLIMTEKQLGEAFAMLDSVLAEVYPSYNKNSSTKNFIKNKLIELANEVRKAVLPELNNKREIIRREYCGDPHFKIDEIAEQTVERVLKTWKLPIAYFSEDRGLVFLNKNPEYILIIDPIDGTRPAMANFESCCFSIAVAPYSEHPLFGEITSALVLELKSGEYFYADANEPMITSTIQGLPLLNNKINLESMFMSVELTAHPIKQISRVCGSLIDNTVTLGAVFVFTSSSYTLTRIITGQLDSHVDIGHRIVQDNPELTEEFLKVGRGRIVTLFPYDIAAAAFILIKAGGIVTDAYGQSLNNMPLLTDKSLKEQCSIIAASNPHLHEKIRGKLEW